MTATTTTQPTPPPTTRNGSRAAWPDLPFTVWPVAQTAAKSQRAGRYHPSCAQHPGKMLPALAARIITEYSAAGDTVVDPLAGTGTTVAEAATLDRRGIGVELEARWSAIATANLDHLLPPESRRLGRIVTGDARHLVDLLGPDAGRVDLIVTSPPYACQVAISDKKAWQAGGYVRRQDGLNYSADRANLGHARGAAYQAAMTEIYAACHAVLRPGGHLAVVTKNMRVKGRLNDLAALTVTLCEAVGFAYLAHAVALHAAIRDSGLAARPSYWQTTTVRHARDRGEPLHLVCHEDVTVFTRPANPDREVVAGAH